MLTCPIKTGCPVFSYILYLSKRPADFCSDDDSFYLKNSCANNDGEKCSRQLTSLCNWRQKQTVIK
ncbi:hypothetical protein KUTeg_002798 [Tegillarca granosa]|uniref:Uncharacterized protein n=1 Tax=Tegillarca granosa TaxID=220873 RepID=A0ABQ9FQS2_TEGGR|nr:hypothetical protein KUTeg_002798 [Tegillarca granosa]